MSRPPRFKPSVLHLEPEDVSNTALSTSENSTVSAITPQREVFNINSPKLVRSKSANDTEAMAIQPQYPTPTKLPSVRHIPSTPSAVTPVVQSTNTSATQTPSRPVGQAHASADSETVPASLASLLHQADKSGKQQAITPAASQHATPYKPTPTSNWPKTPYASSWNSQTPRSGAGAMPQPRSPQLPPRRTVMAPTPMHYSAPNYSQRREPQRTTTPPVHRATFLERLQRALCCSSGVVEQPSYLPTQPPNRHISSTHSNALQILPAGKSARSPTQYSVASGRRKTVQRRWVRPPPPSERTNIVIRPCAASGEGPMLGPVLECDRGRKCLVLDLDETLVHSSFRAVPNPDYILPVDIEGTTHSVFVCKRPGCDEFLRRCGELYEVVIFTASLSKYADPLLDLLDTSNVIRARLFREACVYHEGTFVKDLSLLGRDPTDVIIVDNSPASYMFQPENALPCTSFIDDPEDQEMWALLSFLEKIARVEDVRDALQLWVNGVFVGVDDLNLLPDPEDMFVEVDADTDGEDNTTNHGVSVDGGMHDGGDSALCTPLSDFSSPQPTRLHTSDASVRLPSKSGERGRRRSRSPPAYKPADGSADTGDDLRAQAMPVYNISVQVSVVPGVGSVRPVTVNVPIPANSMHNKKDDYSDPVEDTDYGHSPSRTASTAVTAF